MTEPTVQVEERAAGIVSRGVAAVIDFLTVGAILAAMYVGVVLTRLILHSTAFAFPSLDFVFSTTISVKASMPNPNW